ncbi:RAMP superfamily CRISPR-associated protein [Saccharolobus sp. E5-1-F]|uniref:RAMP superfamily CRISPR-associated protein n=1 Tax=Saccharolobus sp. E5-1-F TaxID=2663019 RepID=UPI0013868610|nr:RAMP superfamily CRISPR-associated protein [Sulfolobus sp. E5-1-F]
MRVIYTNTVTVNNLRGHIESGEKNVDLSAMYIELKNGDEKRIYVIPGSSLKGIIRRNLKILKCDTGFLGSEFDEGRSKMSKVIVGWGYIREKAEKKVKYGIRVNRQLGIVENHSLYSYEILQGKINVNFDIVELSPLNEEEKKCLAKAILLMKYSTIGWGGSRGIGVVEEVKLDDRLLSLLHKK